MKRTEEFSKLEKNMKSIALKSISAAAALAILPISLQLYGQNMKSDTAQVHYFLINSDTLGETASNAYGGASNKRWVAGDANLAGNQNEHAFLWRDGVMTNLGTLGGRVRSPH